MHAYDILHVNNPTIDSMGTTIVFAGNILHWSEDVDVQLSFFIAELCGQFP